MSDIKDQMLYYDWRGDAFTIDQLIPGQLYYVPDVYGNFQPFNKEEQVNCFCCGKKLEFKYKYVVDRMERYCMLCYDVCKRGNYPICVQKVYYQGYNNRKVKEFAKNYSIEFEAIPHQRVVPDFITGNEILIGPLGIRIMRDPTMPKGQIRIVHGGNEILLTGIKFDQ